MSNLRPADVTLTTGNDDVVLGDGGQIVAATAATLTPQTTTTAYPPPDYTPVTTTSGGDTLVGGTGYDTLALSGPGNFRLDELAQFTGFEALTLTNTSQQFADITLGVQDLAVSVVSGPGTDFELCSGRVSFAASDKSGYVTFKVATPDEWNIGNSIQGLASAPSGSTSIDFTNYYAAPFVFTYDLRSATLSNVYVRDDSGAQTFLIDSDTAAGVKGWFGGTNDPSILSTSDTSLDFSHASIGGFTIVSTNPDGTTFTVASPPSTSIPSGPFDAFPSYQVLGGPGHDTLVIQDGTLTPDQRLALFAATSIDTIKDASGAYEFDPHLVRLTAGADSVQLGDEGQTVVAAGNTLTPQATSPSYPTPIVTLGDSLVGGAGYDTLELVGIGNYDVAHLAVFTGFEEVSLVNPTDIASTVSLGAQNLTLSVSTGTHSGTVDTIYLGTGRVDFHSDADSGKVAFFQSNGSGWNNFNIIDGRSEPNSPVEIDFHNYQDFLTSPSVPVLDLRQATLYNVDITVYGDPEVLLIDSRVTSGVTSFFEGTGIGYSPSTLSTADAALDLSHTTVQGLSVVSTNKSGTVFTVADLQTAYQIQGGAGHDTLVIPDLTLTAAQRGALLAASSIETIVDASGSYDLDPHVVRLTAGADSVRLGSGGGTVIATAATLTAAGVNDPVVPHADSLIGGSGLDTLALYGGGNYDIAGLPVFTGFERLTLTYAASTTAYVTLGSQSLTLAVMPSDPQTSYTSFTLGSGRVFYTATSSADSSTFYVGPPSTWNKLDQIQGPDFSYRPVTHIIFAGSNYGDPASVYDLRLAKLANVDVSTYGDGSTFLIDSHVASEVANWYGFTSYNVTQTLSTSDASLDLSHTAITGFDVVSTNVTGTTFTVTGLSNALQIVGGPGYDTLIAQGFALSDDQRATLFAGSSIEVLQDSSGTYYAPVHTVQATYVLPTGSAELHYDGTGVFNGGGNGRADAIYADNASTATLHGGAGDDQLFGGSGPDSLYGDMGSDTIFGGAGDDYVRSLTGEGPDAIYGGAGDDLLTIERTTAVQSLKIDLSLSTQQALGEGSLVQGIEQIRIAGGLGADSFVGGALNDVLKGGAGNDTLVGGGGNDILEGGNASDLGQRAVLDGHDSLTGGAGADTFRFDAPIVGSDDTVSDFTTGVDKVALSKVGFAVASLSDFDIVDASSGAFEHKATLVVDAVNHTLSWDADGNGSGAAVLLAHGAFTTAPGDYVLF